jgi:hypothetical protein
VRDPDGLKLEVGNHGVVRATQGSSTRRGQSRRWRLRRRGPALVVGRAVGGGCGEEATCSPVEAWRKRSALATWRAKASAVVRSCSQARAATRT